MKFLLALLFSYTQAHASSPSEFWQNLTDRGTCGAVVRGELRWRNPGYPLYLRDLREEFLRLAEIMPETVRNIKKTGFFAYIDRDQVENAIVADFLNITDLNVQRTWVLLTALANIERHSPDFPKSMRGQARVLAFAYRASLFDRARWFVADSADNIGAPTESQRFVRASGHVAQLFLEKMAKILTLNPSIGYPDADSPAWNMRTTWWYDWPGIAFSRTEIVDLARLFANELHLGRSVPEAMASAIARRMRLMAAGKSVYSLAPDQAQVALTLTHHLETWLKDL